MASQNDTIVDTSQLTHDDLLEAYEKLANTYRNIKTELDETSQKFHSQMQQKNVFKNSLNDLQSELDQINQVHAQSIQQSEKKVEELKEKNLQLVTENQVLENKIDDFSETIKDLKQEVEGLKGLLSEKIIKPRISDTYSKSLEVENEELRNRIHELESKLQMVNVRVAECETVMEEYSEKIKCLNENIESKKMEVEEKNENIEHMQEKMHELTAELLTLRNTAILDEGNRKGNSLFAEVDEQRQKMKKILQGERQHYLEMKKSHSAKEMEIRRLRRENLNIKSEIQSCSSLLNRGDSLKIQNLSIHLAQLEGENKNLESQLKEMEMRLLDVARLNNHGWIETIMTSASKEVREMKDKVFILMREKTSVIDNISKTMKDLARVKLEVIKYKTMLGRIVDEFKIKVRPEKYADIGINEEFLENLKWDDMEVDGEKEECNDIKIEDEEDSMSGNLNESTIVLLGGRERLGIALPDITKTSSELSFQNVASSSRSDDSSGISLEGLNANLISQDSLINPSSSENVFKENPKMPQKSSPKNIHSHTLPIKPVLQEKIPTPNESAREPSNEPRLARKRAPLVVTKLIIPSKVPKKQ